MTTSALPKTIQELSELLLNIAHGHSDIKLGPKARKAFMQILDLHKDPVLLSITTLANRLDINPSTITRLAKNLGYSGFGAFQEVILSDSLSSQFYSNHARTALASHDQPAQALVSTLCEENKANVDLFIQHLSAERFEQAVAMISSASRVYIYGIRQFHAFASFLTYGLRLIRTDVNILDSSALGIAEELATLTENDLLICASCEPYSSQVVAVANAAQDINIPVLAITDNATSPLIPASQVGLFVPHESSFISNSITVFMLLAECLISSCAAARSDDSKKELELREAMIKRFNIEL
jgi:DNA-binding MurR/RpiR family transcriptional regulator